jgi:hypothetical protein
MFKSKYLQLPTKLPEPTPIHEIDKHGGSEDSLSFLLETFEGKDPSSESLNPHSDNHDPSTENDAQEENSLEAVDMCVERVDFTCNREYAENHDTGDANAITDNSICSTNYGASCSSTKEIINTKFKKKLPAVDETIAVVAKAKADEAIARKRNVDNSRKNQKQNKKATSTRETEGSMRTKPVLVRAMYDHLSDEKWKDVAGWEEDGENFYLSTKEDNQKKLLDFYHTCKDPKRKKSTKPKDIKSLNKVLNNWGFKHVDDNRNKVKLWKHKDGHYRRDHPEALNKLKDKRGRTKIKTKLDLVEENDLLRKENDLLTEENESLKKEKTKSERKIYVLEQEIIELQACNHIDQAPNLKRPRQSEAYIGLTVDHNAVTDSEDSSDENNIDRRDDNVSTIVSTGDDFSNLAFERTLDAIDGQGDTSVNRDAGSGGKTSIRPPGSYLEKAYMSTFVKSLVSAAVFLFLFHIIEIVAGFIS